MISAIIGAVLFTGIAVMNVLVIIGLPLGEFTMGGKYKVLPKKMRVIGAFTLVLQLVAILAVLQAGQVASTFIPDKVARGICIFFGIYLLINVVMTFFSTSKKEKYVMTPLAAIASACFWITVLW